MLDVHHPPVLTAEGAVFHLPADLDIESVLAADGGGVGYRDDVVGNLLIRMPPAWPGSSHIAEELGYLIRRCIDDQALPLVCYGADAGFRLSREPAPYGRIVSPDFAVIRRERLVPEVVLDHGFWPIAPDLCVEVLSPSDPATLTQQKLMNYLMGGVPLLWVIDPRRRQLFVYEDGQLVLQTGKADAVLEAPDMLPGWRVGFGELLQR